MKRRQFLEQTGRVGGGAMMSVLASGAVSGAGSGENEGATASGGRSLAINSDPADPVAAAAPAGCAIAQLQEALAARGIAAHLCERIEQAPAGARCLLAAGCRAPAAREILDGASLFVPEAPEALALAAGKIAGRPVLLAGGSDTRGLVYALLEVADRVAHARDPLVALDLPHPLVERPANPIRSVARLFVSEVEDKPWFYDRSFWPRYLSMLAAQRFNRFSLTFGIGYDFLKEVSDAYLHFAYPFLLAVPDYKVRAVGLPDEERDRNLSTLRFISEAAAARGLHFQLGLWTHGYL